MPMQTGAMMGGSRNAFSRWWKRTIWKIVPIIIRTEKNSWKWIFKKSWKVHRIRITGKCKNPLSGSGGRKTFWPPCHFDNAWQDRDPNGTRTEIVSTLTYAIWKGFPHGRLFQYTLPPWSVKGKDFHLNFAFSSKVSDLPYNALECPRIASDGKG